jgi:murein DD-endopeptidase MepM/ murein hydrolase activator NlpD
MSFLKKIQSFFRTSRGSHFISRWARKLFDRENIRKWVGYQLATATFVVAIADPIGTASGLSKSSISEVTPEPVIASSEVKTETTLAWPVSGASLTQGYRHGHPGIDIQGAPPIFPVDKGTVSSVISSKWGYGNHVYVQHDHGRSSLYAHMSKINVVKGQEVTRDTILGTMGRTGWATGIHLHLEIYQDGVVLNPFQVLPTK